MKEKQYAIGQLEEILKLQEQHLEHEVGCLKESYGDISIVDANIVKIRHHIIVLKDAINKLKGLDNLEKKNKIPSPVELVECWKRPASMTKNLLRTETATLYGRSITSFSLRELAAYIIHQSDRIKELLERKK